jgi:hypothetical protein
MVTTSELGKMGHSVIGTIPTKVEKIKEKKEKKGMGERKRRV